METQAAQNSAIADGCVGTDKKRWNEMSAEERQEALRRAIQDQHRRLTAQERELRELLNLLQHHRHLPDGEVTVRLHATKAYPFGYPTDFIPLQ